MSKVSRHDGILAELFQILKDDAVKVLHSIYQQIWRTQHWQQNGKRSVFIPIPKKGNAKECSKYCTLNSFHMLAKSCSKFPKPGFNSTWTKNFQMFKLGLKRQRNQRSNCQHPLDHWKSKGVSEKHLLLLYWLLQSLWLCGSQQTVENSERDGHTRSLDWSPKKSACRSESNS